jgi:choline dehydrogenase-like flavoprotein
LPPRLPGSPGLTDPNGKIGKGLTDHTIRFRHFTLPPGSPHASQGDSAKVILRHPDAAPGQHAFDVVAEFNQGRYVDPKNLAEERAAHNNWMLCELVFMSYAELAETNNLTITGNPADPVRITVNRVPMSPADIAETDQLAAALFAAVGAQPVLGENGLALADAKLGGVAHEVGTLRMAADGTGVVDPDLKFLAYDNLYACDNSVFPTSPAANPSLTLAALALRLTTHLA